MSVPGDNSQALRAMLILLRRQHVRVTLAALFDAVSTRRPWERAAGPSAALKEMPSEMEALWARLKTGTATESDRALLASLPRCHVPPEELVEACATLCDSV